MQTNPAVEQSKIIRWSKSPWNQSSINFISSFILNYSFFAIITADLEFQTKVYCLLQSLATGNNKHKYSSLQKLSFFIKITTLPIFAQK